MERDPKKKTSEFQIQQATDRDKTVVFDMWKRFHMEMAEYQSPRDKGTDGFLERANAIFEFEWTREGVLFLVALSGERTVGFAHLLLRGEVHIFDGIKSGRLRSLYILPEYRGKGAGGLLVRACEKKCGDGGILEIRLNAYVDNTAAKEFYRKSGYEPFLVMLRKRLEPDG